MNIIELEDSLESIFTRGVKIEADEEGQIIIRTGLIENEEGELIPIVDNGGDDDRDYDNDDDEPNIVPYDESDDYSDY